MQKKVLLLTAMLGLGVYFLTSNRKNENRIEEMKGSSDASHTGGASTPKLFIEKEATLLMEAPSRKTASNHLRYVEPIVVHSLSIEEAYCLLQASGINIPLDGEVKMDLSPFIGVNGSPGGFKISVQGEGCPEGTYSEVELSQDLELVKVSSCVETTPQELALKHGNYVGEKIPAPSILGRLNLMPTQGLFVHSCDGEVLYSKNGEFFNNDGTLKDLNGCAIMDRQGREIKVDVGAKPNQEGCFANGQCVALVEPTADSFEILDLNTFRATGNPQDILLDRERLYFREGVLEKTYEDMGIAGLDISSFPIIEKPFGCESY